MPQAPVLPNIGTIWNGAQHPQLGPIVAQLIAESRAGKPHFEAMARALVWQFALEIARICPQSSPDTRFSRPDYDRLAPALSLLASSLSRGALASVSVGELARLCHLSEAHFRRLFKATLGKSPRDYAFEMQMRLASSLLRGTNKPILEIAQDCGFDSLSSFNRIWKRTFGKAPREWRQDLEI